MQLPFFPFPFTFSAPELLADLETCLQRSWQDHFNQGDYEGDWKIIALRAVHGDERQVTAHPSADYADTELLAACPYFRQVIDTFACDKQAVRLMQLAAGSRIKEHRDYELGYSDGAYRVHVPILTNPDVYFYFAGEPLHMPAGSCWYADFNLPHRVENNGGTPRVHLVMDCLRNDWSDELFAAQGFDLHTQPQGQIRQEDIPLLIAQLEAMDTAVAHNLIAELRRQHG